MAAPVITAAVLDKPTYKVGDLMTLTVTYSDPDSKKLTVDIVVTDSSGNSSAPVKATAIIDPLTVTATSAGVTWTKISDNGAVAVLTATAI